MRSTFKQLFYINRQKMKKNGKCPIMGRITIDGKVSQYSTGYEIDPCLWNPSTGRAFASGKILEVLTGEEKTDIKRLNMQLDALIEKGNEAYRQNVSGIGYVSAEVIKNALLEKDKQAETLLAFMTDYNADYYSRIGIDKTFGSYKRYRNCLKATREFISYKFDREDIAIKALERQFIEDFDFYLTTVRRMAESTVNNHLVVMKLMSKLATKRKIIRRDPFAGYKYHVVKGNHRYLSIENLQKMMTLDLKTYRLCHTRDLFIFSAFTGIGRADLANLKDSDIITKEDGTQWIHIARQKTKAECWIPLLEIPRMIIEKYKGEGKNGHLFFVPQTCCIAQTLKILEKLGEFDQHLTYYMARHTFATQICLSNNVPIETISKMMGHNQIRTTQIYAEITMQKQREDMQKLADGVNGTFDFSTEDEAPTPYFMKRKVLNVSTEEM